LKALGLLRAFKELTGDALLSQLCDYSDLHIMIIQPLVSANQQLVLIGNRFHNHIIIFILGLYSNSSI